MFNLDKKIINASNEALSACKIKFEKFEEIYYKNTKKVLEAFIENKVSERDFVSTTGYGYSNYGRSTLCKLMAQIFKTQNSFVNENFVSGTHALCVSLFALARPNFVILSVTGKPYNTLEKVISGENIGSLKDFNIKFNLTDYKSEKFTNDLKKGADIIYIQRSKGYTFNKSLTISDIKNIIIEVKKILPDAFIIVDNCYGEFVQAYEPTEVGADLVVGSLIKNPGGGIAPTGAYIAGKDDLVKLSASRFSIPGIDIGASHFNRELFMGIYYAPRAVFEALKTAEFISKFFTILGFETFDNDFEERGDIIQVIKFENKRVKDPVLLRKLVIKFCELLQSYLPVESFVKPIPYLMPGYSSEIIMASGGFVSGSSIELSADAPLESPFGIWIQGGTDFFMAKFAIEKVAQELISFKSEKIN